MCALLGVLSCQNARFGGREKGALGGAAVGAGLGAIIGAATGNAGVGTAIGGGIGALSGAVIGNEVDKADRKEEAFNAKLEQNDARIRENQRLIDQLKARGADVRRTERGIVINLPDVLFEFDSYTLTPQAGGTITDIAEVVGDTVRSEVSRKIAVEGHTDDVGSGNYNQRLSERRARTVSQELVSQGIPNAKITTRGLGEKVPIASNRSEVGRARNRRVEVIIE